MSASRTCKALALLGVLFTRDVDWREIACAELKPEPQVPEKLEAGTSLGEEALGSVLPNQTPPASTGKISQNVPDKPLPKQKRPPCMERAAVAINGGCWRPAPPGAEMAPCDDDLYEHKGRCYNPILIKGEHVPISDPQ